MTSFADDVAFLRSAADVTLLRAEGSGPVAVSERLSGRVMTSAFAEDQPGFGLVNRAAIAAGPVARGFANYGGEERLWLSPEGGPHALSFEAGAAQTPAAWHVPAALDGQPRPRDATAPPSTTRIVFGASSVSLRAASGVALSLQVERLVEAVGRAQVASLLETPLPADLQVVAFRSRNRLAWGGAPPAGALVGLWTIGQFTPSDATTVLFPFRGDAGAVKRDYFGVVPDERLRLDAPAAPEGIGLARFTADSRQLGKIGLSRAGATGWIGAWDAMRGVLTLVQHALPPAGAPVPDCDWRVPNPRAAQGDVATSFNHGGEPRFFELESLGAALPPQVGASVEHVSTTIHLGGERGVLRDVARTILHAAL